MLFGVCSPVAYLLYWVFVRPEEYVINIDDELLPALLWMLVVYEVALASQLKYMSLDS